MSEWVIGILLLLNIFQMCFWSYQCQRLINKLMSRNYAEYEQVINGPKPLKKTAPDPFEENMNQEILNELNGLFQVDKTA